MRWSWIFCSAAFRPIVLTLLSLFILGGSLPDLMIARGEPYWAIQRYNARPNEKDLGVIKERLQRNKAAKGILAELEPDSATIPNDRSGVSPDPDPFFFFFLIPFVFYFTA